MCPTVFSVTNYFSIDILFLRTCPDLRAKSVTCLAVGFGYSWLI